LIRWIEVEPVAEQTVSSAVSESLPVILSLSAATSRPCPVMKYGPAKEICCLRLSVIE
jgi:hypothetical protein